MRIEWVIPCRYAERQADGTLMISGAGVDTFWARDDALPSNFGLTVAIRLLGEHRDEVLEPHDLVVYLTRPDAEREQLVGIRIQGEEPVGVMPGGGVPLMFPMAIGVTATSFGVHLFDFVLDDSTEARSVPFVVRPASEQPAAEAAAQLAQQSS
jgi:hypothetical protein